MIFQNHTYMCIYHLSCSVRLLFGPSKEAFSEIIIIYEKAKKNHFSFPIFPFFIMAQLVVRWIPKLKWRKFEPRPRQTFRGEPVASRAGPLGTAGPVEGS